MLDEEARNRRARGAESVVREPALIVDAKSAGARRSPKLPSAGGADDEQQKRPPARVDLQARAVARSRAVLDESIAHCRRFRIDDALDVHRSPHSAAHRNVSYVCRNMMAMVD